MPTRRGKRYDLVDFAQLDLGELYYLADRRVVERGLRYFRDFAVESLSWDESSKRVTALVSGSGFATYEVGLVVQGGQVEHECECPAWSSYGTCKHVVAALAAVFSVMHGFRVGSQAIPEDYLTELRRGLGVTQAEGAPGSSEPGDMPRAAAVLKVVEFGTYGGLRLRIVGPVPHQFLESVGLDLAATSGGTYSREVFLGNLAELLKPFLNGAKKAGVAVKVRTSSGEVEMAMAAQPSRAVAEYDLGEARVMRRICFYDTEDDFVEAEDYLDSGFVLAADGTVYPVANDELFAHELKAGGLVRRDELAEHNRIGAVAGFPREEMDAGFYRFMRSGQPVVPQSYSLEQVRLSVNCSIHENAAGEPERLDFNCLAEVGAVSVDLQLLLGRCLDPVLTSYSGGLLAAKRRVRALLDLIRRYLAEYRDRADREVDVSDFREDFAELFSDAYRPVVLTIFKKLSHLLDCHEWEGDRLAADGLRGEFLLYQVDLMKLLMFLHSMSAAETRRQLHELKDGYVSIRRGRSGSEELRRLLSAAQALGFQARVDELPVRSEPLSISVDVKASGADIDWFALHPEIACGERTIKPEEWQQLIRGDLLLRAEDGALIMPEADGGETAGLQALATMLRVDPAAGAGKGAELPEVSRLQMLDWIALRRHGVRVDLPAEAEALFQSLLQFRELPAFQPPRGCVAKLRDYQKEGCAWIDFLYRHGFGACLADDMGLGKTVQTIAFLVACFERGLGAKKTAPVLIVLPPSLVFNWLDEWQRFAPEIKVGQCLRKADWPDVLGDAQVVLTTYDRVRLDSKQLEGTHFEIAVFDEAHNLKNISAGRTRAAVRLNRGFTLCLTGTPVENHASEFYSVLSVAVPGIFGSHKAFKEAFRRDPERILGRSRPFILRRTKKAILKELPKKEEQVVHLEMSALQKEIYTRTVAEVREEIAEAFADRPEQQAGIVALAAILRLRQVCVSPALLGKAMPEPSPKMAYIADKLEELQAEGHAALVFSQFIGGLDGLEAVARERGLDYVRMDGATPVAKRKAIVSSFQDPEGPSFFFISLKTGGVGLNLTRANYVFHLDPWWNPAVENQATDRAHRIGQSRAVLVQRLIMQHSIESRMMELKNRKADLFRQLVEQPGAKTARFGLSRQDFDYLLTEATSGEA